MFDWVLNTLLYMNVIFVYCCSEKMHETLSTPKQEENLGSKPKKRILGYKDILRKSQNGV